MGSRFLVQCHSSLKLYINNIYYSSSMRSFRHLIVSAFEMLVTLRGIRRMLKSNFMFVDTACGLCANQCSYYLTSLSCALHSYG